MVILYHAGFTYQSIMVNNWIVIDSSQSDSLGLIGLYIDIFVMAILFFISGYFIPASLKNHSSWTFLKSKFKRIILPWILAVVSLIPLYKIIYLYSRGLPQEEWYSYFHWFERAGQEIGHFSNNPSQHWLWYLPVLFLFQVLYLIIAKTGLLSKRISLKTGVMATLVLGLIYSMTIAVFDLTGWSLNILMDFQRERLLVYFLFFLLGSLCYKLKVFDYEGSQKRLIIISNILLTVMLGVYTVVAINFLLNMVYPDREYFFISQHIDGLVYYTSLILSMLTFLFILTHTFKSNFNKSNNLMRHLNKNSYYVYIIHMIVLGIVALGLELINVPPVIKYILLAILTFCVSNVLINVYNQFLARSITLKVAMASMFVIGFILVTTDNGRIAVAGTKPVQSKGLHEAVIQGDLEAINMHIEAGSDLNVKDPMGGSTPLITAAVFGKTDIANALIKAGADVDLTNNEGSTALITAAFFCRTDIVKALLKEGANKEIKNNAGSTALDSVTGPYESVKGIYDYFSSAFGQLGLDLNHDQLRTTRPIIAEILQDIDSLN
jgi:hypothetical protein